MKLNSSAAAPPPDVRRGSASPFQVNLQRGYAPGSALAQRFSAGGRAKGEALNSVGFLRRGVASPHIRQQSRGRPGQTEFRQARKRLASLPSYVCCRTDIAQIELYIERVRQILDSPEGTDVGNVKSRLDFGSRRCPRNKRGHRKVIEGGRLSRSSIQRRARRDTECSVNPTGSDTSELD